jgi:hypothetical protein
VIRPAFAAALLLLAACATARASEPQPDAAWLVGLWCPDHSPMTYAGVEVGLRPTRFKADGTYSTFEDAGQWRLAGERLDLLSGLRMRSVDRVERLGRNAMARHHDHGEREIWHRCTREQ